DDPALASLIVALRTMRACGGTVRIVTQREEHRQQLAVTGLDKVFEIFASRGDAEDGGVPPGSTTERVRFAIRAASAAVALILGIVLWPAAISAQDGAGAVPSDPAALRVLAKLIERNPTLQSFEAGMRVDVKMTSFPFLRPILTGKTYYKRPANYEVVFDRVPSYAKGLEHL